MDKADLSHIVLWKMARETDFARIVMTKHTDDSENIWSTSLLQREACLKHARDLLESAKRVLGDNEDFPNVAFHLTILALEEVGKAGMIIARAVGDGSKDTSWVTKRLDDHIFKLMWAIWSPSMLDGRIEPKKFEDAKRFAREAHERRLSALYVDHRSDQEYILSPDKAVSTNQVLSMVNLAYACLDTETSREVSATPENGEQLEWYWKTVSSKEGSSRLFSKPFIDKLEEFGDDVKAWMDWAKLEFEKIQKADYQLLQAELSRVDLNAGTVKERWIFKIKLVSLWHTFQQKALNVWNEALPSAKLEIQKGSNNRELILSLRLNNDIHVNDVFDMGLMRSKMLITALNIGSAGYIWYDISDQSQSYFKSVKDLDTPNHRLQIRKPVGASSLRLKILEDSEWRTSEVLRESYITNSLNCMVAFFEMSDDDAAPIFSAYMDGLALLSMTNLHVSCDHQAIARFRDSLSNAMKRFSGWDGGAENERVILHDVLSNAVEKVEHRNMLIEWDMHEGHKDENKIRTVFNLKRLVDLYLLIMANKICNEKFQARANDAG